MQSQSHAVARWPRVLRFLASGGLATLAHWLCMFGLVATGTDARLATAIGATVGLLLNYAGQYRFAFRSSMPHRLTFPRYLTSAGLAWVLNLAAFSALYAGSANAVLAQVVATAAVTLANYALAERFVFQGATGNEG